LKFETVDKKISGGRKFRKWGIYWSKIFMNKGKSIKKRLKERTYINWRVFLNSRYGD
jgi:hypothetical protein